MSTQNTPALTCEQVNELINEYIDGELDSVTAAAVASHLETCTDCRRLYDELLAVCRAVEQAGECEPPEGLHERIMNAVNNQKRHERRRKFMSYMGVGVAAMLCISVLSSTLIQRMATNSDDTVIIWSADADGAGGIASSEQDYGNEPDGNESHDPNAPSDTSLDWTENSDNASGSDINHFHENTTPIEYSTTANPAESERVDSAARPEITTVYETTTPIYADTTAASAYTTSPTDIETMPSDTKRSPTVTPSEPYFSMEEDSTHATPADPEPTDDPDATLPESSKNESTNTSAPQYASNPYNTWSVLIDGIEHKLTLRADGSFTYDNGNREKDGTYVIENGIITLRYGLFGKSSYTIRIANGNMELEHVSGRRLFK